MTMKYHCVRYNAIITLISTRFNEQIQKQDYKQVGMLWFELKG